MIIDRDKKRQELVHTLKVSKCKLESALNHEYPQLPQKVRDALNDKEDAEGDLAEFDEEDPEGEADNGRDRK